MQMKNLVFNVNWWSSIKLLGLEDRKEVIYAIVAQELESEQPGLMSEAACTVWAGIAKELRRRRQQRLSYRNHHELSQHDKEETEQSNEKEVLSPALLSNEKEKKKEKENLKKPPTLAEIRYQEALERDYPNISRMPLPLTFAQYQKLLLLYPSSKQLGLLKRVLTKLNRYDKISKYRSTYLTIIKWMKREQNENNSMKLET